MSAEMDLLRRVTVLERALENTRATEPIAIRLPFVQSVLNPFPLASSGGGWGNAPQSRALTILGWPVTVYVVTTNSGAAYWTIALNNDAGVTLATVSTAAISANVGARLTPASITQPASSNTYFSIVPTATGSPGAIYIIPELIVA